MRTESEFACGGGVASTECLVETAIHIIGGKWKLLLIRVLLLEGPKRFNRLLDSLAGVSSKVLTQNLSALVGCGVVERRVISQRPRRVEYALTPIGLELTPIFKALGNWRERFAAGESCCVD